MKISRKKTGPNSDKAQQNGREMNRVYFISRISLAIIWFYHGLVPKLIYPHSDEIMMNEKLIFFLSESTALIATGVGELIYAALLLVFYRSKILLYPTLFFGIMGTLVLLFTFPTLFVGAFNPFSINLSIVALALINLFSQSDSEKSKP